MRWLRSFTSLWWLSLRRMAWSVNTVVVLLPLIAAGLFILRYDYSRYPVDEALKDFTGFLVFVYAAFFVPICAIAYGATSIGGDREDRMLVFLLVRPIARPWVLLAKYAASLPLTLIMTMGSFWSYCQMAGPAGEVAFPAYAPAIAGMTAAYVSLFHFFAVLFRHATILALIYSLFIEVIIGALPGIIKRVAINYYGRVLIIHAGVEHHVGTPEPRVFELIDQSTAAWALVGITVALLVAAMAVFQQREYRDLT